MEVPYAEEDMSARPVSHCADTLFVCEQYLHAADPGIAAVCHEGAIRPLCVVSIHITGMQVLTHLLMLRLIQVYPTRWS